MILLDTNILVRSTNSADPLHSSAKRAVDVLRTRGERLIIVPQNLYEFWAVATRPPGKAPQGQNGLGMMPMQARAWLKFFQRRFVLLIDRPELNTIWQELVAEKGITGFKAHDARLVAAMRTFQMSKILTFNLADFAAFDAVTLDPASV
jgi:predicted nucleic acid-binding protein